MAAVTDLTFDQVKEAAIAKGINANAIVVVNGKVMLDVGLFVGVATPTLASKGVIKLAAKFLDFCAYAQNKVNEDKDSGEHLLTFSAQADGTSVDGKIPVTRSITASYDLSSVTQIAGIIG